MKHLILLRWYIFLPFMLIFCALNGMLITPASVELSTAQLLLLIILTFIFAAFVSYMHKAIESPAAITGWFFILVVFLFISLGLYRGFITANNLPNPKTIALSFLSLNVAVALAQGLLGEAYKLTTVFRVKNEQIKHEEGTYGPYEKNYRN